MSNTMSEIALINLKVFSNIYSLPDDAISISKACHNKWYLLYLTQCQKKPS